MNRHLFQREWRSALKAAWPFAAIVTVLVFAACAARALSSRKTTYSSTAHVRLQLCTKKAGTSECERQRPAAWWIGGESEVVRSDAVLREAVDLLGLTNGVSELRASLEVRPVEGGSSVRIRAGNANPGEAARIANAVATAYCARSAESASGAGTGTKFLLELTDKAQPASRPDRHYVITELAWGMLGALLLGTAGGLIAGWKSLIRMGQDSGPLAVFYPLALTVCLTVLGTVILVDPRQIPAGTIVALTAALLVGGIAEWLVWLRNQYPMHAKVFTRTVIGVLVLALGLQNS